jgi:hypothetical protein
MECTINWLPDSGMAFAAETGSGHLLTMDGAPDGGGRNLAPRPMETLLAGAGACTAYDVVLILKRGRQDVRGCEVKLRPSAPTPTPRCSPRSTALHGARPQVARGGGGACHRAVAREVLFGHHHAGQDRRHHDQPRPSWRPERTVRARGRCGSSPARPRISQRTGAGSAAPPAASASSAWRASSSFICATTARDSASGRQALQVAGQVGLDLAFGLDHETQADAVAGPAGQQADRKGAGVPQRVQQAGAVAQFIQARSVQARWSVSSRPAATIWARSSGVRASAPARRTGPARRPRRHGSRASARPTACARRG